MMRIYIAGPMRGKPYYNFPAFDAMEKLLKEHEGIKVVSPANLDRDAGFDAMQPQFKDNCFAIPEGFNFLDSVTRDIDAILTCDAICMLDGWEDSKGARAEKALAEWLGLNVLYENFFRD